MWAQQDILSEDGVDSDGDGRDAADTAAAEPVRLESDGEPALERAADSAIAESGAPHGFAARLDDLGLRDTTWSYVDGEGEAHGPFDAEEIVAWWAEGHFDGGLQVRLVSPSEAHEDAAASDAPLDWVQLAESQLATVWPERP